uniref:ARAD1C37510p n=1 Tax=Blastobotrys adeninivorans TaxID=409370 RepID=A0A060T9E8_BLAAD
MTNDLNIPVEMKKVYLAHTPGHGDYHPHQKVGKRPTLGRRSSSFQSSGPESGSETPGGRRDMGLLVPNVRFFLDNKLPMSYFKQDVLRLIHSLRISQWKRVPMEAAEDLVIKRLSGALTNSIFVVEPPAYVKSAKTTPGIEYPYQAAHAYQSRPGKLLLRVYGAQSGNLIDRDEELAILERLSQKEIGPKLLGTFSNGRFEQYLEARPLTKNDLRDPDTSCQIAKRMRELHDNIPLHRSERNAGPAVWLNVDKWLSRAKQVLEACELKTPGTIERVLHSDFATFVNVTEKYRSWLYNQYGDWTRLCAQVVFCHNDTQYGNIMRFLPPPGSPLLRPQNEYRQLVVIDFEYSAPNTRGYEIANHFSEWMNDYHGEKPELLHLDKFPDKESQMRFINEYVEHAYDTFDEEEAMQRDIDQLVEEVRLWGPAPHLFWGIWAIIQAKVDPEADRLYREQMDATQGYKFSHENNSGSDEEGEDLSGADDSFDYFVYSSEKMAVFWNELIRLGVVDASEYKGPKKTIPY